MTTFGFAHAGNPFDELLTVVKALGVGWRVFERMLREAPLDTIAKLIGLLGAMLKSSGLELNLEAPAPG